MRPKTLHRSGAALDDAGTNSNNSNNMLSHLHGSSHAKATVRYKDRYIRRSGVVGRHTYLALSSPGTHTRPR